MASPAPRPSLAPFERFLLLSTATALERGRREEEERLERARRGSSNVRTGVLLLSLLPGMPPRTQSAHLVLLSTLPEVGDPGPRIRVVGRSVCSLPRALSPELTLVLHSVVGRDVEHSYVLIEDEELAVSVDLSNVVGMEEGYLPALKDLVMVTGELCLSDVSAAAIQELEER